MQHTLGMCDVCQSHGFDSQGMRQLYAWEYNTFRKMFVDKSICKNA